MNIVVVNKNCFENIDFDAVKVSIVKKYPSVTIVDEETFGRDYYERKQSIGDVFCITHRFISKKNFFFECMSIVVGRGGRIFVDITGVDICHCKLIIKLLHKTISASENIPDMAVLICHKQDVIKVARFARSILFVNDLNLCDAEIAMYVQRAYITGLACRLMGKVMFRACVFLGQFLARKLR